MPRHVVTFIGVSALTFSLAASAFAQPAALVTRQASLRNGSIAGVVRDDAGRAVAGASIIALGGLPMPVMVRSDTTGRFLLALPPGQYILRATREGYVSAYREPVRVQSSVQLERTITLVRAGAAESRVVLIAASGPALPEALQADAPPAAGDEKSDHAHNETAWRLRHLAPTALRDIAVPADVPAAVSAQSFKTRGPMGSFLANTDFSGQVNFLTSSSLAAGSVLIPAAAPRGIAYVAVSAPVGDFGDWTVRGATNAGSTSSWVLLGEYSARRGQTHALNVGVSYSSQLAANGSGATIAAVKDQVRTAGGMYAFDRWRVWPALEVDYGVRIDRYDYVAGSTFFSPRGGLRLSLLPATNVTARVSEQAIAPGSEEFLPPPSSGPWLPPERTFTPLVAGALFYAERVRYFDVGVEQQLGRRKDAPVLGVRRFRQHVDHQTATLFGLDAESGVGHYYVAAPGTVTIDGFVVHLAANLSKRVKSAIDYTVGNSTWLKGWEAIEIAAVAPSVVRATRERLHDLTASVEAQVPETATRVAIAYRTNSAFSRAGRPARLPVVGGRFNLEVHQAVPFEPIRGSKVELLLAVRTLFFDLSEAGSMYDELLTVAPPLRILGGVQVKF
jgi:hypothetical protein